MLTECQLIARAPPGDETLLMKILEYSDLDTRKHQARYKKVVDAIARDDFRQADVKKLVNITHGAFYRAKLDDTNRLLFKLIRHQDAVYALMLEVIEQHAYEKSRFLRGAVIDEAKLPAIAATKAADDAESVRYVHPERRTVHLLDKVISFDDAQALVYGLPAPLILVGSAGSGKTALTLEKLKRIEGHVLYVTQSSYLAQSADTLYHSNGFDNDRQEVDFFSYRELIESLKIPAGREAGWRDFSAWIQRQREAAKGIDSHQAFEEIRGVITADADGALDRDAYLALGIRQSIFPRDARERVYDLFEKYRRWLDDSGLYDLNLVSHAWRPLARPRYDFVVVDEVQDLTNAQLALILALLANPGQFLLCGDSNQIVHPNFFSWSRVKSLFWQDAQSAEQQELQVLRANFRNSSETTRVANTLLKIKHARFGSIDRESNFLVDAVASESGGVSLLNDKPAVKKDLDNRTRASTRFAVLVLRDEDKAQARQFFRTPLIFSVHEAKGLEYENIVLYRFVSDHRQAYAEIAEGVDAESLRNDELAYRRARDKSDKSLEVYKFFVNALYVALTRAIRNVYLIESDHQHPLLQLLQTRSDGDQVDVNVERSSLDDWQKEARKLELQGKQEQAAAIRETVLKTASVPWPVFDETRLRETLTRVFRQTAPGNKPKQQLFEYATAFDEPMLAHLLEMEAGFSQARGFDKQRSTLGYKHLSAYASKTKDVLRQCDRHGVDHRTPMNLTPLIAASMTGNIALIDALIERGARADLTDHLGRNALHWALLEAFRNHDYARHTLAAVIARVAPAHVDVQADERLIRIDRLQSEYLVFQTVWALYKSRYSNSNIHEPPGVNTGVILDAWAALPAAVLRPERNRRQHLSSVLSRNEIDRNYAYNRRLFKRLKTGWYQLNPMLLVRESTPDGDRWVSVLERLNLPLIYQLAAWQRQPGINALLKQIGVPPIDEPIAIARTAQRLEAEREAAFQELLRKHGVSQPAPCDADPQPAPPVAARPPEAQEKPAPWGTPLARRQALDRLREQIVANQPKPAESDDDGP